MRITNVHSLPQPLYEALCNDTYDKVGDISVTGLIQPPIMRRLHQIHGDDVEVDASDLVFMFLGTLAHGVIERHGTRNRLAEERLTATVNGWTVSGKPDLYEQDGTISDYKVTSVWAFMLGDKPEWVQQLNMYAWLYRQHSFEAKRLQIVALLRDWSMRRASVTKDYPKCGVYVQDIELWTPGKAAAFVEERVRVHKEVAHLQPEQIPVCAPDERWEKPTVYAVKKRGNKTAMRGGLCDTREQAEALAAAQAKPCDIEVRNGECVRCKFYCNVAGWCPHGRRVLAEAAHNAA